MSRLGGIRRSGWFWSVLLFLSGVSTQLPAEGEWEITPESEQALQLGLEWLRANQGKDGNWTSNDLGLVAMGALAFMSDGHAPGRGKFGNSTKKALDFVIDRARPSGLLNVSNAQRDMYNHGLATFVLGQAHGTTTTTDRRLNRVLDRALQLIASTQCEDGGWDYHARRRRAGHDLSLVVMQAKALRSAMDSGLEVPPEVVEAAIQCVRQHYAPANGQRSAPEVEQMKGPGQFTYTKGGGGGTDAMAAAGVVCLQEFGQYDDWRIVKNMDVMTAHIQELPVAKTRDGKMPFDAYTLYYVGQALYQVGGPNWRDNYPKLRDYLVKSQIRDPDNPARHGSWRDVGARGGGRVGGRPGELYGTAVACFILAIPNRYLPILQEGRIAEFRDRDE
ncbi:MAG TPA: squalene--hopene cyclase [Planctomycetaceae bacterium]|nr:squalene--hopene cyclase [Blastopirellula sp.]HAY80500.1 squalene--hopene cyclase [Planctomycetaceae bacterium]